MSGERPAQAVSATDPVDALFGDMQKLGPGSNADTLEMLRALPEHRFGTIVDAGCGTGRQTLVLAKELGTPIHAVDTYRPFLVTLERLAAERGLDSLIHVQEMDMGDIPKAFAEIDLLWCEGAAYNIGFGNALSIWKPAIRPGGFVVVSELAWLREGAPEAARAFFRSGYPGMQFSWQNTKAAEKAGYRVLGTHTLRPEAWVDGYYDLLEPRAVALSDHTDSAVRDFARETLREIEVFRRSEGSFGYVFYVLQCWPG